MYKAIVFDVGVSSSRNIDCSDTSNLDRGCGDAEPLPCSCGIRADALLAGQLPQRLHVDHHSIILITDPDDMKISSRFTKRLGKIRAW